MQNLLFVQKKFSNDQTKQREREREWRKKKMNPSETGKEDKCHTCHYRNVALPAQRVALDFEIGTLYIPEDTTTTQQQPHHC